MKNSNTKIVITKDGATYSFECAVDQAPQLIKTIMRGRFETIVRGEMVPQKPEKKTRRKYSGKIDWTKEELSIVLSGLKEGQQMAYISRNPVLRSRHTETACVSMIHRIRYNQVNKLGKTTYALLEELKNQA